MKTIKTIIREFLNEQNEILLAPNGEPSNLPKKLYEYVRTEEFKKWFGDWENNQSSASKIVDENGEPMIYFKSMDEPNAFFGVANNYYYGITVVSPSYDVAKGFQSKIGKTYNIFINSRKPFDFRISSHKNWLIKKIANNKYADLYTKIMNDMGSAGYNYTIEDLEYYIEEGAYSLLEWDVVYNMIKEKGYDSFYVMEDIGSDKSPNLALFSNEQIKIIK